MIKNLEWRPEWKKLEEIVKELKKRNEPGVFCLKLEAVFCEDDEVNKISFEEKQKRFPTELNTVIEYVNEKIEEADKSLKKEKEKIEEAFNNKKKEAFVKTKKQNKACQKIVNSKFSNVEPIIVEAAKKWWDYIPVINSIAPIKKAYEVRKGKLTKEVNVLKAFFFAKFDMEKGQDFDKNTIDAIKVLDKQDKDLIDADKIKKLRNDLNLMKNKKEEIIALNKLDEKKEEAVIAPINDKNNEMSDNLKYKSPTFLK